MSHDHKTMSLFKMNSTIVVMFLVEIQHTVCRTSPVNGQIDLHFDLPKCLYSQWLVQNLYGFHKTVVV